MTLCHYHVDFLLDTSGKNKDSRILGGCCHTRLSCHTAWGPSVRRTPSEAAFHPIELGMKTPMPAECKPCKARLEATNLVKIRHKASLRPNGKFAMIK